MRQLHIYDSAPTPPRWPGRPRKSPAALPGPRLDHHAHQPGAHGASRTIGELTRWCLAPPRTTLPGAREARSAASPVELAPKRIGRRSASGPGGR